MTLSPWDRQRARRFAAVIDGEQAHDRSLADLFVLASALRVAGAAVPAPADEFKASLRQRLLAVSAVGAVSGSSGGATVTTPTSWRRRLAAVGTAVAITTGSVAGTAMASAGALPGDTLYDVKRIVENVQIALSMGDAAKGKQYLEIAGIRLGEVASLINEHGPKPTNPVLVEQLATTLGDMGTALHKGRDHLLAAYEATGDPAVLAPYSRYLRLLANELAALTPMLPEQVIEQQAEMLTAFRDVAQLVASVSVLPTTGPDAGSATTTEGQPAGPEATASPEILTGDGQGGGLPGVGQVLGGGGDGDGQAQSGSGGGSGGGVSTPAPLSPQAGVEPKSTILPSTSTVLSTLEEITNVLPEVEDTDADEGLPAPGE